MIDDDWDGMPTSGDEPLAYVIFAVVALGVAAFVLWILLG